MILTSSSRDDLVRMSWFNLRWNPKYLGSHLRIKFFAFLIIMFHYGISRISNSMGFVAECIHNLMGLAWVRDHMLNTLLYMMLKRSWSISNDSIVLHKHTTQTSARGITINIKCLVWSGCAKRGVVGICSLRVWKAFSHRSLHANFHVLFQQFGHRVSNSGEVQITTAIITD
jgi:hypothetical protein